ncbi:3-carboxy-cis,cis-muconate cycloisomerase [Serratia proteamaculans]|jgi:3-carboxy-cis,cis-muconate cycloisomerase|uniref:3-carboxy-cis,cis-muconate cycloisomerase n=1 Tax=Serratia proteamaculans TaxID=28151 RepID=UPI00217B9A6F|nr:3-carboxy-cis,cis-muconate cycloisomerase [Serratia proteamaculans]CAI0771843.1 3-carboxy-cis,cis-muconate cycloisomerase [Serratia proteamaculans]CAI0800911.1 3-carboxy-cis,cis-muconate cycloisomerase [Serratia proteamaculans]CAI0802017.1 3-carboxy-cis,cis-muconate cycloisomerase [Serratia proteamaculans]CAI1855460.1 3-carboxy-cis,cis-muconate cycloisomerase [Serratia proteamaculans]
MELLTPLLRSSAVSLCFSDVATLQGMLDFEAALATAQARLGIIPAEAGQQIAAVCHSHLFDVLSLAQAAAQAGNLAIPLVKQLTSRVAQQDAEAARYVHWGATSQDAIDTGLVLQLRQALTLTQNDLDRLIVALVRQITRHQDSVLVGRTWMQHALPTTLGLKLAGTLDALLRYRQRLDEMRPRVLALQLGGAAGTLASLGEQGESLVTALAARLQLTAADTPWHSQRDRLLEIAGWYAGLSGTLGKLARDISLLTQTEVAEVAEPVAAGRGGSSTMPHKRNPVACAVILAAANRVPALVSGLYAAMLQEHERGLGGWHAEWESLPELVMLTAGALHTAGELIGGLQVFPQQMEYNLKLTHGLIMAEAVTMALGEAIGRQQAHQHIEKQCHLALVQRLTLSEVLLDDPLVMAHLSAQQLSNLLDPQQYLGSAKVFTQRVLEQAAAATSGANHDE